MLRHIVRPIEANEFIPNYSTDVLLLGVCHVAHIPKIAQENKSANTYSYLNELRKAAKDRKAKEKRINDQTNNFE